MTSEGIYRKSGVNSRVAALDERFHRDARSLCLRDGEHQVDDVSNTLKRFFRELKDGGLFTLDKSFWLNAAGQPTFTLTMRVNVKKFTLQVIYNRGRQCTTSKKKKG